MRPWKLTLSVVSLLVTVSTTLPINLLVPFSVPQVLAQTVEERKAEADRLLRQGWEQLQAGRFEAAIQFLQQALIIFQSIEDRQREGNTLNSIGISYYLLRDYSKAIELYKQSLAITREIKDRDGEMSVLINLGRAYYSQRDDYSAIDYYLPSLKIARELKDRRGEGAILNSLGNVALSAREYPGAIEFYEKSLNIVRELNDKIAEEIVINNLAVLEHSLRNFSGSAKYYEQSLAIIKEIIASQQKSSFNNLGIIWGSLNNYPKILSYSEPDDLIAQQISDTGSDLFGSSPNSEQLFRLSSHQTREINYKQRETITLLNLGNAYRSMGNYSKAIDSYEEGLTIAREIKDKLREGIALNNLGNALFEYGKLKEAEKNLRQGIKVWESLREELDDRQKVLVFEEQAHTYRYLQKVLITDNRHLEALEIAERGRARAFVALLTRRIFSSSDRLPAVGYPSLNKIQQIAKTQKAMLVQYSIMYKGNQIISEGSKEAEIYIWVVKPNGEVIFRRTNLTFLRQQESSFVRNGVVVTQFIPGGPRVFQQNISVEDLVTKNLESIAIGINRGVSDNSNLRNGLSFFPGDLVRLNDDPSDYPAWQVVSVNSQNRTLVLRLPTWEKGVTIERSMADATKVSSPNGEYSNLQQLHKLLIEPIADLLPTDPKDRVIFIPQGALFFVPFPALQDANKKFLIEKHTILTAPSIQVLDLTRQQRQRVPGTAKEVLVAGNPIMPKVSLFPGEPAQQLTPLPAAEQEATEVAQMFKTQAMIGSQATKAAILPQLPKARIIHLATHGLLNDYTGGGVPGAIALAPSNNDNGLLTASEILDLKLNAELVVLSACNTGKGRITGDGVIGLSRSLISAGVPSVVVSLWSVPDAPTASLMTEFYRQMQQTGDKAQALRQAMLTTLQQHPEPKDWAAFTLIGEAK